MLEINLTDISCRDGFYHFYIKSCNECELRVNWSFSRVERARAIFRKGIASEMGAIGMYITRRGIELREKNRGKKLGEEMIKWPRQMANRFAVLTALFR